VVAQPLVRVDGERLQHSQKARGDVKRERLGSTTLPDERVLERLDALLRRVVDVAV
jgi:hypothetical protein